MHFGFSFAMARISLGLTQLDIAKAGLIFIDPRNVVRTERRQYVGIELAARYVKCLHPIYTLNDLVHDDTFNIDLSVIHFGNVIRCIRYYKGITQKQQAAAHYMPLQRLRAIEYGGYPYEYEKLQLLNKLPLHGSYVMFPIPKVQ
jgi:DNA-binding XRE family transcriptional regulator